jgi:hypothetical protein
MKQAGEALLGCLSSGDWVGHVSGVKRRLQVGLSDNEFKPTMWASVASDRVKLQVVIPSFSESYEFGMVYDGKDLVVGKITVAKKVQHSATATYSIEREPMTQPWMENYAIRSHVEELRKVLRLPPLQEKTA